MLETKNADQAKDTNITAEGIKNFLSAVCEIVVYDLKYSKNFASIELVLKKLQKDTVFTQAIEGKADILYQEMYDDIDKTMKKDQCQQGIVHRYFCGNNNLGSCWKSEFCTFVSFFLPKEQRDKLQEELLKGFYSIKQFKCKIPTSLEQYLLSDIKEIIYSKNNQQNNIKRDNNLNQCNHYVVELIKDDNDEFNNDKELQRRYVKLLRIIRDDIVFGNNAGYKENKNELLTANNTFIEKMSDIQKTYKQMPGWLRSKFEIGCLDDLTIREKYVMKKNDSQILFYELNKESSYNKICPNINAIRKVIDDCKLSGLESSVEVSTAKICLMNILSFFYYGLNLKFFADLFRLDMHKEDFTILIPLSIVMAQIAGFVLFPFYLPLIHFFSVVFGLVFLIFNLLNYEGKFISSEDIRKYNLNLNRFSNFIQKEFYTDNINQKIKSVQESSKYDEIIDKYERTNNLHIPSGYHENYKCDCLDGCCECGSCDRNCYCPDAGECLCACLNGCAQDPRCCELCCLLLLCPLCAPCIAGGR